MIIHTAYASGGWVFHLTPEQGQGLRLLLYYWEQKIFIFSRQL